MSARIQSSETSDEQLKFHRFVINSLPTAVVTVDSDMRVTGLNPWAERILGYTLEEVKGRFCGDILRSSMCRGRCPLQAAINGMKPVSLVESTITNRHGEIIPVRMSAAALLDDQGALIGGVESFQDISRIKTLERERNNIVSMFAHDLKSSISIIGGFVLRLLKHRERLSNEKQEEYLNIIRKEVSQVDSLISSFLDFSRLMSGRLKLDLALISIDKEILDLLESYQIQAAASGIELQLVSEEPLSPVEADSQHLRRVFRNLLDNALKFSKPSTKITVSLSETPEEIRVTVQDQGTGIPSEDLPFIFDAFGRGRTSPNKEGFGLGLAGAKRIVKAHGGRIEVRSVWGRGSTFSVVLPKPKRSQSLLPVEVRSER